MARTITGRVSSDKADKTIVVTVTSRQTHPLYKKQYSRNRKYIAHDEKNQAKVGDVVLLKECRPISARKRFTLEKVLEVTGIVYSESDAEAGVEDIIKPKVEAAEEAKIAAKTEKEAAKDKK